MSVLAETVPSEQPSGDAQSHAWIAAARAAVRDLTKPDPRIYWLDLLTTVTVAYTAAYFYLEMSGFSTLRAIAYVVAVIALYRAAIFTHELVHLRRGTMTSFRIAYDVLYGIPALFPAFTYEYHADHHKVGNFGTERDGEYMPLRRGPRLQLAIFFAQVIYLPIAVVIRFLILTPISFLSRDIRRWVLERGSSLGMTNLDYRYSVPDKSVRRIWALVDLMCFLRIVLAIALIVAGINSWTRALLIYSLACGGLVLNCLRVLGLHGYCNDGDELSHTDQLADTVTIANQPVLTFIIFPLGMSYHTLHHLFPTIPYHNLGEAHRRLMKLLPKDSLYVRTVHDTYGSVLRRFWSNIRETERRSAVAA